MKEKRLPDNALIEYMQAARKDGTSWREIAEYAKKDGYVSRDGTPYSGGGLCNLLLDVHPEMQVRKNGARNRAVSTTKGKSFNTMKLIEVIMDTSLLSKKEKLEAIKLVSETVTL